MSHEHADQGHDAMSEQRVEQGNLAFLLIVSVLQIALVAIHAAARSPRTADEPTEDRHDPQSSGGLNDGPCRH